MRRVLFAAACLTAVSFRPLFADDCALYYLSNLAVQYEGTGYRQDPSGWELKVKPQGRGLGARWRHDLSENAGLQVQYWRNNPYFSWEDGNSESATRRQTGQTRLAVQNLLADYRRAVMGSRVEAVAGLQGVYERFERKDIVYKTAAEAGRPTEVLAAGGIYVGFHGGNAFGPASGDRGLFYWDGELLLGNLLLTKNAQRIDGGSIHQGGYTYLARLELGLRWKNWRASVGQVRQMMEITVPGGKALPGGAAASLPINKVDFDSPFLAVTYAY